MSAPFPHNLDQHAAVVLVVDDDADMRWLIRDAIEEAEHARGGRTRCRVVDVASGEQAVAYLRHAADGGPDAPAMPDLIYMDVEMPGIGGLEAVRQIRADPRLRDVPVVMLSGLSDAAAIGRATACGANSYTVKPADADLLARTVLASTDYWLNIHQTPLRHPPQSSCRR